MTPQTNWGARNMSKTINRRQFITGTAGLVIGIYLPFKLPAAQDSADVIPSDNPVESVFAPNAFIRIAPDDSVTVVIKHIEFGQGPYTGLSTLVAEELDADWGQMRATSAPADNALYANSAFGIQGTGGSTAMANSYTQMRKAGATARAMLVAAAAQQWGVPGNEITILKGKLNHQASGNSSGFGALASAAAKMAVPSEPKLKDPKDFTLIGTQLPKLDSVIKTNGTADFTIDIYREGMQTVAVAHAPRFGGKLKNFEQQAAMKVKGVNKVAALSSGVAVYADNTYAAFKGREALQLEWDDSGAETRSSDEMIAQWRKGAVKGGKVVEQNGEVDKAMASAATVLEAEYVFPYLAHSPMEPMDGVIELKNSKAEAWLGAQFPVGDQSAIAKILGLKPEDVSVHTMLTGGSFGRRAQPGSSIATEVAEIAKMGGDGSYKMLWSRSDDVQGGYYRPLTVHRLKAALDANGDITAWQNDVANQSILRGTAMEGMMEKGLDPTSFEGSNKLPYGFPSRRVTWAEMKSPIPVLWWRSVGHTHTAYATETFLNEALIAGNKDPVAGRLALIKDSPRHTAVLSRVADMANWAGAKAAQDTHLGVALHKSFNTYVAMIVQVSNQDGLPKVHKVWAAVDCGVAVNPNIIRAQIEGGVGYALSAAMFSAITLKPGGLVEQSNFDNYRILRINEMPQVEVSIIQSTKPPTGIGEPGVPPLAPAVANAWHGLTGHSLRELPFSRPAFKGDIA